MYISNNWQHTRRTLTCWTSFHSAESTGDFLNAVLTRIRTRQLAIKVDLGQVEN